MAGSSESSKPDGAGVEAEAVSYTRPEVLARIARLGLRAQRLVEGSISGLHRSPLHGASVEFADYREYAPGDDLKRLDWRAYARSNRYFIKRYEEESNLRATVLLDASASMRYGRGAMTKFDYAATLAASLAWLCIKQRDAAGLALVDTAQRAWIRPAASKAQLSRIIETLERARPDRQSDLGAVMSQVCDQIRGRGVVIVISDLLVDLDAFYGALGRLQHEGHEVMIFQVLDRDEIELPFGDSVLFRDIEGSEELFAEPWAFRKAYKAAMERFIDDVTQRCRLSAIDHVLLRTDEDLAIALSHYLHKRQRAVGSGRSARGEKMLKGAGA
jgi:uncharacterized protein (DUF58 family)